MLVTLAAGTHKLQFEVVLLYLCRAVGTEDAQVRSFAQPFGNRFRQTDADAHFLVFRSLCLYGIAAHDNDVDVGALAVKYQVAHPAADDVAVESEPVGFFAYKVQDGLFYFRVFDKHHR